MSVPEVTKPSENAGAGRHRGLAIQVASLAIYAQLTNTTGLWVVVWRASSTAPGRASSKMRERNSRKAKKLITSGYANGGRSSMHWGYMTQKHGKYSTRV